MRTLNLRLLLILILGTVVTGIAAVAVHGMQVRRFAQLIQQRARDAKAGGRSEEAMELYQRYIALVPRESVDSQIELGILLADAGQNARSSRILEAALRVDSTRDDARRRLAKLELQDRSYLDARQNLDVLIANSKDDRDLAELLDWRAQCELAIGDDVTAAASLELAIEKAPERLESYAKLAAIREARLKDPTGAQAALDAMVATNQDAARAYVFRGAHLLRNATGAVSRPASGSENDAARDDGGLGPEQRQAALEAALSDSRRALELAPDDDAAIALGINCLAANKQFDEARELARRGLMLRPKNATMYSLLAKIELRNRSRGAAIDWLERGLKVDPANQSLLWDYALLLIDERRGPDAEKVVPALVRAGYPLPPIEFLKSLLLIELESWHAASRKLEQIRAALVPWPELSKQADFRLGQCYQRLGRSDLQLTAYRRAASADPNWVPARLGVAEALSATGKIELAMEEYDQITRLPDSDQARGVALLQRVRLEIISNQRLDESKRNWSRANQILDALEKSSPDQSQVAILRAEILFAQGDRQQAEAALRASLDRAPETLDYWLGLSVLAERRGDLAEAQRLLDGAEARLGDSVEVRLARARLLHNRSGSDAREAIRKLAQPSDSYSSDDKIRLYTGMANVTLAAQDYDETERLCELVARERKSFLPVRLLLFDLALRAKRTAAMEQLLTEVEQIEGKGPLWNYGTAVRQFVLALEARTARNAGVVAENCRQAKQHLAEARTARQNWSRIPLLLAEIDELQEDDVAAISNYYKAIELGERSSTILSRVVFLLYQHRQYAKADELIGHLKQQGTPFSNDMVRLAAEVALGLQDNESALKWTTEFTKVSREVYEHLWAGQKLFILGQHAEAEQSFRKAIAIDESSAEPRVALVLHLGRNLQDLKDRLARARANPKSASDVPKISADLEVLELKIQTELEDASRKIAADQAPLAMAQCYESIGETEKAEIRYQAVLAAKPNDIAALRRFADFYRRLGRARDAEPYLTQIISGPANASDEERHRARRNLAFALMEHRDQPSMDKALALIRNNLKDEKRASYDDRKALVIALIKQPGRDSQREAVRVLEELLASQQKQGLPEVADDRFLLADLYLKTANAAKLSGDTTRESEDNAKAAMHLLQLAASRGAREPGYVASYIKFLLSRNEVDEAFLWIERLKSAAPREFATAALSTEILLMREQYERILPVIEQFVEEAGVDVVNRQFRRKQCAGLLEGFANRIRKPAKEGAEVPAPAREWGERFISRAEALFREDIEDRPREALELARFKIRTGNLEEALDILEREWANVSPGDVTGVTTALLTSPGTSGVHLARAEKVLQESIEKHSRPIGLLLSLADQKNWSGDYDGAEKLYREVLVKDPRNPVAMNNLALILALRGGHGAEALDLIKRAIDLVGNDPSLLDSRATIYLLQGNTQLAASDLSQVIELRPSAMAYFHQAQVFNRLGQKDAARQALSKSRELGLVVSTLHPIERKSYEKIQEELR